MASCMLKRVLLGVFMVLGLATFTVAEPITFDFTFSGIQNNATGVGYITFEDTLLPNPGALDASLPNPAILDLSITIAGAAAGDGTYDLSDFVWIVWDTEGGFLDFSIDLVGQPTAFDPWGTPTGTGGDFNLFAFGGGPDGDLYQSTPKMNGRQLPPHGVNYFTLAAEFGTGDQMLLTAMRARQRIPTLGTWGLLTLVGLMAFAAVFMRKNIHAK